MREDEIEAAFTNVFQKAVALEHAVNASRLDTTMTRESIALLSNIDQIATMAQHYALEAVQHGMLLDTIPDYNAIALQVYAILTTSTHTNLLKENHPGVLAALQALHTEQMVVKVIHESLESMHYATNQEFKAMKAAHLPQSTAPEARMAAAKRNTHAVRRRARLLRRLGYAAVGAPVGAVLANAYAKKINMPDKAHRAYVGATAAAAAAGAAYGHYSTLNDLAKEHTLARKKERRGQ